MNAIIELAELMRMAAENGYVGQVRDRLSLLMQSAMNLRSVITNMLDLSKIEAGRMRAIAEEFDIAPVLHEIAETTRVLLGGRPAEVIVSTERSSVMITSDPVRANGRTRDVMVVLHSSNDEDHLRTTARRLGLNGYMVPWGVAESQSLKGEAVAAFPL